MVSDILQPTHLLLILVVALLVLGPKRLPEVGRAVGRSIHDFRGAINGEPEGRDEPRGSDPGRAGPIG
ncbi:MAG: twin-arginine translocase TatA/TatE family subunit [Solirubrobacteraceae bacterium]|jgi:sec-independent protein translocase protein TatA